MRSFKGIADDLDGAAGVYVDGPHHFGRIDHNRIDSLHQPAKIVRSSGQSEVIVVNVCDRLDSKLLKAVDHFQDRNAAHVELLAAERIELIEYRDLATLCGRDVAQLPLLVDRRDVRDNAVGPHRLDWDQCAQAYRGM